jgi:hypothetical protein
MEYLSSILSFIFCPCTTEYDIIPLFSKAIYSWLIKSTDFPFDVARPSVVASGSYMISVVSITSASGASINTEASGIVVHSGSTVSVTSVFPSLYANSDFPLSMRMRVSNSAGICVTPTSASTTPCFSEADAVLDILTFKPSCPISLYRYTASTSAGVSWSEPRLFYSDGREVALDVTEGVASQYNVGVTAVKYATSKPFDQSQVQPSIPVCTFNVSGRDSVVILS